MNLQEKNFFNQNWFIKNFYGGFYFESNYKETFIVKCRSWRYDAILNGGGTVAHADSSNNEVTLTNDTYTVNGEEQEYSGGSIIAGRSTSHWSATENNVVNIFGNTINGSVYAGYSWYSLIGVVEGFGDSNNNKINISGGTFNGDIFGGYSYSGSTNSNSVIISGSPVFNSLYIWGGANFHSYNEPTVGYNYTRTHTSHNNNIEISGTPEFNSVHLKSGVAYGNGTSSNGVGSVQNNTIKITGDATFNNSDIVVGQSGSVPLINNTLTISGKPKFYSTTINAALDGFGTTYSNGNNITISDEAFFDSLSIYG